MEKQKIGREILLFLFLFLVLTSTNFSLAEEERNFELESSVCINQSREILIEMEENNFNVQRINDTLSDAEDLFQVQVILKSEKKKFNFEPILTHCEEISQIKKSAFEARDEYSSLKKFYSESLEEGINTSSVDEIISQIESEIRDERYEQASALIESAYEEIIKVKSDQTTLKIFYDSTATGFKNFFLKSWKTILFVLIFITLLLIFYHKKVAGWLIERKIKSLETRKKTIHNLIMQTQREYFEEGKIPEGKYNIRINKFGELIRDINRQIPLLKEELVKVEDKRKGKKK
jgi:hypothetical protein